MENTRFQQIKQKIRDGALKKMLYQTKWIYRYVRQYRLYIVFYTIIGLLGTFIALGSSLVSKDLIDIITGHQTGVLVKTFSLMIGLAIGSTLINQLSNYISNWISMKVESEIKSDIFEKMLETDLESIMKYHTGDLLTRWNSDAVNLSTGILSWIPSLIIQIVKFVSAFAVVIYYDPTFAIFSFIGVPFTMLMSKKLMKRMVHNNQKSAKIHARMSGFNQEAFSNIQTIKAFDLIGIYVSYLKQLQREYITMRMDFQRMSIFTSILMSTIGLLVSYSSYGWGIYRVWSGVISYGTMTMFLTLSGSLTGTLNSLISLVPTAINLTTSAGRLIEILDMPRENFDQADDVRKFEIEAKKQGIHLSVCNLSYAYQSGTEVFRNVNLSAHPHEIVAMVGPSGEGKTTMLRLLLALLRPQEGEITLANEKRTIPLSPACRKLFSYVPQGNTMFSGTILENMRNVKPDATKEEIISALKLACAWEFVEKLPRSIESPVGERGAGFSEGQSQRLSIARALLRKSPILLLDEATSALDVATEKKILRNIMEDSYARTCLVTTHRPTVLSMCHRAYQIENLDCHPMDPVRIQTMMDSFQ